MHEFPPEVETKIRAEARRFREPLPKRIENKPDLFLGSALYLNAWFELDTERDRTKYQRINRSMCFGYAQDYELSEEQRDDLWFFIQKMDSEFLEWWIKRQPKPREPKVKKGGR